VSRKPGQVHKQTSAPAGRNPAVSNRRHALSMRRLDLGRVAPVAASRAREEAGHLADLHMQSRFVRSGLGLPGASRT
jgi:hypothetical protein